MTNLERYCKAYGIFTGEEIDRAEYHYDKILKKEGFISMDIETYEDTIISTYYFTEYKYARLYWWHLISMQQGSCSLFATRGTKRNVVVLTEELLYGEDKND